MRRVLRRELGTLPVPGELDRDGRVPETGAYRFAAGARPVLDSLVVTLYGRTRAEMLMGFPAAPFVLPLATDDVARFLDYGNMRPDHKIRLSRAGQGAEAEWRISPAAQHDGLASGDREGYRLTFSLPEHLESWISEHEKHRTSRIRKVKQRFLSDIVIYRMEGDSLQTFQLQYEPGELDRRRHNRG